MDKVFIEGLEIETLIGIYDWERRIRQPLVFDLEMAFDNRIPAASDAIGDTLDYKAVSRRLVEYVSASSFGLVETLAERCAEIVLREFDVAHVRLKLSKPGAVRGARAVGVVIERSHATARDDGEHQQARAGAVPGAGGHGPSPAAAAAPRASLRAIPRASIARGGGPALDRACSAYLSLGSNIEPERNLRTAVAALRARFGEIRVSPVYRTPAAGFDGPDFLNAIAVVESDVHPFALHAWLHRLEEAHGRDRRDAAYSNRPLDIDIIYFGHLVLDGPGDFQLPRPELHHAYVLKPLADVAPDFVDPIRGVSLAQLWAAHPQHATPPERIELALLAPGADAVA